jgi:hypothetical protein
MKQHQSSTSSPQEALWNLLFVSLLCIVVVTGTIVGYPGTYDLSLRMRAGHHLVHVEMKSHAGLALASASASGRIHGG